MFTTDQQVLQELLQRKLKGSIYHEKFYETFRLIALQGYATHQAYRKLEEYNGYIKVQNFIIDVLQSYPDNPYNSIHIGNCIVCATSNSGFTSVVDKPKTIENIFKEWLAWELETIDFLTECHTIAMSPTVKSFIASMQEEVVQEYQEAHKLMLLHEDRNWDNQFTSLVQSWLVEKYEPLLEVASKEIATSHVSKLTNGSKSLADLEEFINTQVY